MADATDLRVQLQRDEAKAILVLTGHALRGVAAQLAEVGRTPTTPGECAELTRALGIRDYFAQACLIILNDESFDDAQIVAAAVEHGRSAARQWLSVCGPPPGFVQ